MKSLRNSFSFLLFSMVTMSVVYAGNNHNSDKTIVGVWNCNVTLDVGADYVVETFHSDGTVNIASTIQNSQTNPITPEGAYISSVHGIWRKVGKNLYEERGSEVYNLKVPSLAGIPGVPAAIPGVPPFIAGVPVFRSLRTVINKLSADGNTRTLVSGQVALYPIANIDFVGPPALVFTFANRVCHRLQFPR